MNFDISIKYALDQALNPSTMKCIGHMFPWSRHVQCATSEMSQESYNLIAMLKLFRKKKKKRYGGKGAELEPGERERLKLDFSTVLMVLLWAFHFTVFHCSVNAKLQ